MIGEDLPDRAIASALDGTGSVMCWRPPRRATMPLRRQGMILKLDA
jgi:hypothetical protein